MTQNEASQRCTELDAEMTCEEYERGRALVLKLGLKKADGLLQHELNCQGRHSAARGVPWQFAMLLKGNWSEGHAKFAEEMAKSPNSQCRLAIAYALNLTIAAARPVECRLELLRQLSRDSDHGVCRQAIRELGQLSLVDPNRLTN